jgi:hypothetical protein
VPLRAWTRSPFWASATRSTGSPMVRPPQRDFS